MTCTFSPGITDTRGVKADDHGPDDMGRQKRKAE